MFMVYSCVVLILFVNNLRPIMANDSPSLLIANASMAIIIDRAFLGPEYDHIVNGVEEIAEKILREDMKRGGLVLKYYAWTEINFQKDITAVLIISNCENTWTAYKAASEEGILVIAITDFDCPRLPFEETMMNPIIHPGNELPQILLDIKSSKALKWNSATLLYDDAFSKDTISRIVVSLTSSDLTKRSQSMSLALIKMDNKVKELEKRKAIYSSLMMLRRRPTENKFIVVTSMVEEVIQEAKALNMLDTSRQWLFVQMNGTAINLTTIEYLIGEGVNIAIGQNVTDSMVFCESGILCHVRELFKSLVVALQRLIKEETAIYGQISDEEWESIRQTKHDRRDSLLMYIREDLLDTSKCSECIKWTFSTAETWGKSYQVSEGKSYSDLSNASKMLEAGHWTANRGFLISDSLFPHIEQGFRGIVMNIVSYHNPPWQIVTQNVTTGEVVTTGIILDILSEMGKKLNFTYVFNILSYDPLLSDNRTSSRPPASTFTLPSEVIQLATDNQVFLIAIAATENERYKPFLNFSTPISIQNYALLVSRPKELSRLYLFAAPFAYDTWICLTVSLILSAPLLYMLNYWTPYNEVHGIRKSGGLFKLHNCFWYIYGALLQQGGLYLPKSDSARILVGTWWLVVLVIITTYCGNLVAFLTLPNIEIPISTVSQLVQSNKETKITWSIREDTYLIDFMRDADQRKYEILADKTNFYKNVSQELLNSVKSGRHVLIDWRSNLEFLIQEDFAEVLRCELALSEEQFIDERIGLIIPLNSPYINLINNEIIRMHQMGFIDRWLKKYMPQKNRCSKAARSSDIENHTVNLLDMQGCFLVLLIGYGIGWSVILIEIIWFKKGPKTMTFGF